MLVTRLCLVTQIRRLCLEFDSVSKRGRASGYRFPGRAGEPVKISANDNCQLSTANCQLTNLVQIHFSKHHLVSKEFVLI